MRGGNDVMRGGNDVMGAGISPMADPFILGAAVSVRTIYSKRTWPL